MPWYDKYKQVADNASTSIPTPTGKSIVTDNSPYTQNQFLGFMEGMRSGVQYDKQQEQNRISQRKNAELAVDKNQPFTLPSGQTKKFSEMDFREKRYVEGTALENRGRMFPNEESIIDYLNPLNWITSMAGNMSKAPYEAEQSNSNMPYLTALAEPLLMGRVLGSGTINPFSKKMWTNSISDASFVNSLGMGVPGLLEKGVNKVVQSTESGLLSNAYKLNPWAFKPNPEAYYRGVGKEGLDDILESGIIRSKKQHAYPEPYFSKGAIGDKYANGYFAELTNEPMKGVGSFSTGDLIQTPVNQVAVNNPNLKLYKKDWLKGYKQVETPKINFDNYLSQKQAVQARAERMLSQKNKWVGQNNNELINKFNNASENHYDDLTSFEWNSKFNDAKSPESLGVNKFGKTVVYKDAPLSEANKARTAAHEAGHYYRNTFEEGKDWNSFFDFSLLNQKTRDYLGGKGMRGRGHIMGDEIRERAAQLKDYIAHKNKIPLNQDFTVTKSQLDDALKNYTKDTKLDNDMTPFISSLKDKNGFLKAMNKYALTTIPAAVATGAATQEYKDGGQINNWTDKYKN